MRFRAPHQWLLKLTFLKIELWVYVALAERSNTPTDQYPQGGNFVRAHHDQNNSRR
jgi:hypothetical protein